MRALGRLVHDRDVGIGGERFPDQLVAALRAEPTAGRTLELVANLAVNGYTTADLIRDELPALDGLAPGFVTLCIGVNDVVQGVPPAVYEERVTAILAALLAVSPERVVVVAIPDYTVTPAGADYGEPAARSAAIDVANATMARLCADGRSPSSTSSTSRSRPPGPPLVADDGLHPSGAQYARWVERIASVVRALVAP